LAEGIRTGGVVEEVTADTGGEGEDAMPGEGDDDVAAIGADTAVKAVEEIALEDEGAIGEASAAEGGAEGEAT